MKSYKILLMVVCLLISCVPVALLESNVAINERNFPDSIFLEYVKKYDEDKNKVLSEDEIVKVEYIDVENRGISSLQGIGFFTSLRTLYCSQNNLKELGVSNNKELRTLECASNELTSLDVSNNKELRTLRCDSNEFISLDVSNNAKLNELCCESNKLTSLDVSMNEELYELYCSSNRLKKLDVSNNSRLGQLDCHSNQLTTLDVSDGLTVLWCESNKLTSLDISKNEILEWLFCADNQLTSLDISKNERLEKIDCSHNKIKALDLRGREIMYTILNDAHRTEEDGAFCYRDGDCCVIVDKDVVLNDGLMPEFLTVPKNVKVIGKNAFAGTAISIVEFTEDDITIGAHAFANCANLFCAKFTGENTTIAPDAFEGCDILYFITNWWAEEADKWAEEHGIDVYSIPYGE